MHHSFWSDLATEFKDFFARWWVAVVGLTVVPSVAGAVFVPAQDASAQERLLVAVVAAVAAVLCLSMAGIAISLIRVPIKEYRRRHLQAKLGQECIDCARQIVGAISSAFANPDDTAKAEELRFFRVKNSDVQESITQSIRKIKDLDDEQIRAFCLRYETECAPRVYRCATELHERGHIDKEQRDKLRNSTPVKHHADGSKASLVVLGSVQDLVHIGVRLGGRPFAS